MSKQILKFRYKTWLSSNIHTIKHGQKLDICGHTYPECSALTYPLSSKLAALAAAGCIAAAVCSLAWSPQICLADLQAISSAEVWLGKPDPSERLSDQGLQSRSVLQIAASFSPGFLLDQRYLPCTVIYRAYKLRNYWIGWCSCPNILIDLIEKHMKRWKTNLSSLWCVQISQIKTAGNIARQQEGVCFSCGT